MSDNGHTYFFGSMPEMPWKRKDREMDNEFKKIVLKLLIIVVYAVLRTSINWEDKTGYKVIDEANEYLIKLE